MVYFTPLVVLAPLATFQFFLPMWLSLLTFVLSSLGGCWIKLGQWASTRPDLFSDEVITSLNKLADQCPSHSFSHSERSIIQSFQLSSLDEFFLEFDPTSLASGTIAQVHKGTLHDGRFVAVKVLHPGIRDVIESDLALMRLTEYLTVVFPSLKWLGLVEALDQFEETMRAQLDLNMEAANMKRFQENFATNSRVFFPTVIRSSPCVLVETFEEGEPMHLLLKNISSLDMEEITRRSLANLGFQIFFQMMLIDNFLHADLHTGNILVREVSPNELGVVILDCGLVTSSLPQDWQHLKELLRAVASCDGRLGGETIINYATTHQLDDEKRENFLLRMDEIFSRVFAQNSEDLRVGAVLTEVLDLIREYKIKLHGNFATLIVGALIVEGIGKQLHPSACLSDQAKPFLFKAPIVHELVRETYFGFLWDLWVDFKGFFGWL
eukprot:TRINITY_DN5182_c0_g1_i9.p1 TRINITY_DN5182_c0_g1~~TRINITY_DN5182_c0_g1_i9.p1  ORF type:complete len:438 (+),score=94.80 TRINITY_DN5182_c0_g1_i9:503-1816(+)